ncbi:protein kinase domain-containing protein [Anabaena sp. CCY 0017]|uniref:protein kinase domain-containing protein n=1 Tax=Anabaena sp. CCY 0017 TaxID=3103866 RepID=UPI0039C72EFE
MDVYDGRGNSRQLGEQIGGGGQGNVYLVESEPNKVVKIFHPDKLKERGGEFREKIELQKGMTELAEHPHIAWPRILVFDQNHNPIGYAMKRVQGVPLTKLAHAKLYERFFPDLDRIKIVEMLLRLLDVVAALHKNQVYIGDINLENIICNPQTFQPYLIDADSYQVKKDNKVYRCPVGRPEMTPIEHHQKDFQHITRTVESDLFSLAILMFQCLMIGRHPYDNIGGGNPVENLRNASFPYGKGGARPGYEGAIPKGDWYNIWSHLTYEVKGLFIQTLKDGVKQPLQRASIADWEKSLESYFHAMQKGYNTKEMKPKDPKQSQNS